MRTNLVKICYKESKNRITQSMNILKQLFCVCIFYGIYLSMFSYLRGKIENEEMQGEELEEQSPGGGERD